MDKDKGLFSKYRRDLAIAGFILTCIFMVMDFIKVIRVLNLVDNDYQTVIADVYNVEPVEKSSFEKPQKFYFRNEGDIEKIFQEFFLFVFFAITMLIIIIRNRHLFSSDYVK